MKKKIIWTFISLLILGGIVYCSILCIKDMNKISTETDVEGKEMTKEEYVYKEDLLSLGYSMTDIYIIEKKISNIDVNKYLLTEKYDNLTSFLSSPYFDIKNIKRYEDYYKKNNYSFDETVLYVKIGLDYDFYTNIVDADTSKGLLVLVNKYNKLDKNYDADLINVESTYGNGKMNKIAYEHFKEMCDAAKKDNIKLRGISIFRSNSTQESIYNNYVKRDGVKKADTYSARPGHSEHETGLGVDINTASSSAHFENTKEYDWLINNSYKYGFILRYPKNKEFITGYKYEPWHYRYLGAEVATKIFEENITYEEYIAKYEDTSY